MSDKTNKAALRNQWEPGDVPEPAQPVKQLCEDEGCPHHGTPHVCINTAKPAQPMSAADLWAKWHDAVAYDVRAQQYIKPWGWRDVAWQFAAAYATYFHAWQLQHAIPADHPDLLEIRQRQFCRKSAPCTSSLVQMLRDIERLLQIVGEQAQHLSLLRDLFVTITDQGIEDQKRAETAEAKVAEQEQRIATLEKAIRELLDADSKNFSVTAYFIAKDNARKVLAESSTEGKEGASK